MEQNTTSNSRKTIVEPFQSKGPCVAIGVAFMKNIQYELVKNISS